MLPLALNHMPRMWESIVRLAIREYVNLNNSEQLAKYPGPVMLIRRTQDEVICLRYIFDVINSMLINASILAKAI